MKNVKDYNKSLNEGKKVRPEEIEDYFTNSNSGTVLHRMFNGKFDEKKFRDFLGAILDKTKRTQSVINIWSGYFGLNPKDYTSGEIIEDVMFLDDITVAAKEAYETFVNEYVNEGENDFADNPSMNESKVLTGEEVAKALRKLDQKYDGVMSKDFIIKVKRLKRVTKETLEKMGAKGKILDDIFDLLKEGKDDFAGWVLYVDGNKIKSYKSNIDAMRGQIEHTKGIKFKSSKVVKESLVEASDDFAGWVAIYNKNRIEIDKSEASDISQAKQIAIKKLKVPKSKVGLLAIAPGYNESMHEGKNDKMQKSIDTLEKDARKLLAPIEVADFISRLDKLRQFIEGNLVLEDEVNEGKNDYSARFDKTDITIKNGHKLTDEDSLYDMYEKIGKVIKDSGLDLGSVIIK